VLKKILLALVLLAFAGAVYAAHEIGIANIVGMLRYDQRREGALHVGDAAPDVALGTIDGEHTVPLLAALRGKPLVLIFGSYT